VTAPNELRQRAAAGDSEVVEHAVIISRVIRNGGCPCPGIGDVALDISDTVLHFGYNLLAYVGVVAVFVIVWRHRHRALPVTSRR
jgi:hypothetical protein